MEAFSGIQGIGVSGQKGMAGVTCVDCHMWSSPEVTHGYYLDTAIGTEHRESHDFEPKAEACADCHSDLIARMPNLERPANNTETWDNDTKTWNHELWAEWDAFGEEWNETVEMWEMVIHDWEENFKHLSDSVEANYEAAGAALASAEENGTATQETLDEAQALLDDAQWNIGMTDDGSMGVHNPDFFTDLLNSANVNSNKALEMLTTNGPPIANAGLSQLVDKGDEASFDGTASSDMDGTIASYFWDFGDGTNGTTAAVTHTYATTGTYLVKLMVTDNTGAMDTDMITVFVVEPVDLTAINQKNAEQDEKIENATGDKNEISDLEDSVSSVKTGLVIGLIVVLIIVLGLGYFAMENLKKEISKAKEGK
jgi:hypothetical protein